MANRLVIRREAPGEALRVTAEPEAPPVAAPEGPKLVLRRSAPGAPLEMVPTGGEPAPAPTGERTWPEAIGETALMVGVPMGASLLGGPGAGALAGMGMEALRQRYYGEEFNPELMGVEGALNLIPGGKAGKTFVGNVAKRGLWGAGLGVGGEQAREVARGGGWLSPEQALQAGTIGTATGGALGVVEKAAGPVGRLIARRRAPGAPLEVQSAPEAPPAGEPGSPTGLGPIGPEAPPPPDVSRETMPPPLRETYGPSAPRTTGPQGEMFGMGDTTLTVSRPAPGAPLQTKVSTSQTRQNAPGPTQPEIPPEGSRPPPPVEPAPIPRQPEPKAPPGPAGAEAPIPAETFPAGRGGGNLPSHAGQGGWSPEAEGRLAGEKARGVRFIRQRIAGGEPQEMPGTVDRVDIQPRADEVIYRVEGDVVTPERLGPDVPMARAQVRARQLQQRMKPAGPKGQAAKPGAEPAPARVIEGPTGREIDVFGIEDPTKRYRAQFRAVPLDDLQVNVEGVQTRQRGRQASQQQVDELARNFDPDRYLAGNEELDRGVPIVGPDLAVESGNGRVAALRRLREQDPARFAQLIARQQARAAEFGLNPQDIGPDTVVVRERLTPVDRQAFVDEANARTGIGMAPVETAPQDARRLEGVNLLELQVGESQTIDQALLSPRNRAAVARFLDTFPANEKNALVTADGSTLNPSGVSRMKAAILAKTYGGPAGERLVRAATESADTGVKNVESAIFQSLGKVARAMDIARSGARQGDLDIAEDIATVTAKLAQIRAEGGNVETYLKQGAMFDRELTPFQESLLDQFDTMSRSAKRIRRLIESLADEVVNAPETGQTSLLGMPAARLDKDALLERALNRARETGLFGDVGAIGRRARRPTGRPGERRQPAPEEEGPPQRPADAGYGPVPPKVRGAAEGPPPADVQRGRLSSTDPDKLAPSLRESTKPEDIQRLQDGIAEQIRDNVEYARRGVVPVEETFREAAQYGLEDVLDRKRGQAWNAAQLAAAQRVRFAQLGNLRSAWQKAASSRADADRIELMRQVYLTHAVIQQTAGASAEAGRALQIHSQFVNDPTSKAIQKAIERAGGVENIDQVIDDLARFDPNDVAAMQRYVTQLAKATIWDKAHEYFIASLVSGPQTHIVQGIGNLIFALERPALKAVQVGVDVAKSAITGAPRERFAGEIGADLFGMASGIRGGIRAGLQALSSDFVASKLDQPMQQAIGGRLGRIVRFPLRALAAGDEVFKAINTQGHLRALAYRRAMKEGRTGEAFHRRVAEIVARPDAIEGLRDELAREALYRTFQTPGGKFTQAAKNLRRSTRFGPFIAPFIQTPVNVFKATVERSPFALIDILQRVNAGTLSGAQLSDDLTRAAVGTAIAAATVTAFKEGMITGFGPTDPRERAAWRATGKQPYSFRVPKPIADSLGLKSQWINYGRIEPWGTAIGWAADLGELMNDTEAEDAISKSAFLIGKGITSKTWMQGVSGFFNALDEPDRYLQQFIQKFAGSVLVPNAISQIARVNDPVLRKPRSIGEMLQTRIGAGAGIKDLLEEVGPIRDVFGEPVLTPGGPVERALSPIYRSYTREEDPARAEIARLGIAPGSPQNQLQGIELTPKEYDRFVERSGQLAHRLVTRLVTNAGYRRIRDDETKADMVAKVFTEARAFEREKLRPSVLRRAISEGQRPKRAAR